MPVEVRRRPRGGLVHHLGRWRSRLVLTLLLAVVCIWAAGWLVTAGPSAPAQPATSLGLQRAEGPFPPYSDRWRIGVGVAREYGYITDYDVSQLCLGWYQDWGTLLHPPRPEGIEYMQTLRLSPENFDLNNPASYNWTDLEAKIRANPGSVWMIGTEPDGRVRGACDRRYPDEYARIYKIFYDFIKGIDPTAKIANGAIIQPTPLRMDWLTKVWDAYRAFYGTDMPVDVWNIHNQMVREVPNAGADIPLGCDPALGRNYSIQDNDSLALFIEHIVRMRQWMKDHGQQNKPLIISEYGVLMPEYEGFTSDRINEYMTATFTYLLYARDPNLGLPEDDYHLVQRWAWFALNTPQGSLGQGGWNGELFNPATHQITEMGRNFSRFACRATRPTPTPNTTPLPSVVHREAEHGSAHGAMGRYELASASDCRYVQVVPSATATEETVLAFNVFIPSTGDYVIWGRVWGVDYLNKSFNVSVDGGPWVAWYFGTGGWHWSQVSSANPPVYPMVYRLDGPRWHSIRIGPRGEGKARLDIIQVTSNRSYTPNDAVVTVCNPTPTATSTPSATPTATATPTITPTPTVTRTPMPAGPGRIVGRVQFQGRGTPPGASWAGPLVVAAHLPGDPIPAYAFTVATDEQGNFQVPTGLLPGTYDVAVRDLHSLRNMRPGVAISQDTPPLDWGTLLAGDANGDNRVSLQDLSILANTYGQEEGSPGYDARADFNNDRRVSLADLSLLATNYGTQGDILLSALGRADGPKRRLALAEQPLIYLMPAATAVAVNQDFILDVYCATRGQKVDAVEVELTFDTERLAGLAIEDGPIFTPFISSLAGGVARYVAYTSPEGVEGTLHLCRLRLRTTQVEGQAPVTIAQAQLALAGELLQPQSQSALVTVLSGTPSPTPTRTPPFLGAIGGAAFVDLNDNRERDPGEPGVGGVVIELSDATNALLGTVTTAADGGYAFDSLAPGSYRLRVIALPAGYEECDPLPWVVAVEPEETVMLSFALRRVGARPAFVPLVWRAGR